jgi:hypothetical protein
VLDQRAGDLWGWRCAYLSCFVHSIGRRPLDPPRERLKCRAMSAREPIKSADRATDSLRTGRV